MMHEYHGEFEVHITVRLSDSRELKRFQDWCNFHEFKYAHILLARGDHVDQPMATYRRSDTSLSGVLPEALRIAAELQRAAFPTVRLKIEADLLNQNVPQFDEDAIGCAPSNYFEHHVKLLRDRTAPCDLLLQVCVEWHAHLSRNAWRDVGQGKEERFVTLRYHRVGRNTSDRQLRQLLDSLNGIGEQIIELESEYCVYDSNLDLDCGWLNSESLT